MFVIVVHSCSPDVGHADVVYSLALEAARHCRSTAVIEFGRSTEHLATIPLFGEATALQPVYQGQGTSEWLRHLAGQASQGVGQNTALDSLGSVTSFLHAVDTSELSMFDTLSPFVRGAIEHIPGLRAGRVFVVPGGMTVPLPGRPPVDPGAPHSDANAASGVEAARSARDEVLQRVAGEMRQDLFNFRFRRPEPGSVEGDDSFEEVPLDAVFVHLTDGPDGLLNLPLFRIADHILLLTGSTPDKMPSLTHAIRHLQHHCLEECGSMGAWLSVAATTPEVPGEWPRIPTLEEDEQATESDAPSSEGNNRFDDGVPDLVRLTVRATCRLGRSGLPELPPRLIRLDTIDLPEGQALDRRIPEFALHRMDVSDCLTWLLGSDPPTSPRENIPVREPGRFPAPVFLDALHWSWPFGEIVAESARDLLPPEMIPADFCVPDDFDVLMQLHSIWLPVEWFSDGRFLKLWKDFGSTARSNLEWHVQELAQIYLRDPNPVTWIRSMLKKKSRWATLMLGDQPAPELTEEQDEAIRLTRAFAPRVRSAADMLSLMAELTATETKRRFAEPWFVDALTRRPDHAGFHSRYARFLDALGKEPERAEEHFRTAMTLAPSNAHYCLQYGQFVERIRNDPDEADALYEKVLQLSPEHALALVYRCRVMLHHHDRVRAHEFASLAKQSPTGGKRLFLTEQAELGMVELCLGPQDRWPGAIPQISAYLSHPYREPCPTALGNLIPMTAEHPHHEWIKHLVDVFADPKRRPEVDGWDLWRDSLEEDRQIRGQR